MIDKALQFVAEMLNRALATRHPADDAHVVLGTTATTEPDPRLGEIRDKLVLSLINIERESVAANLAQPYRSEGGGLARARQPLNVNLVVLLAANFPGSYSTGLQMLSSAMSVLQAHPLFTRQGAADLPAPLERITVEWCNLNIETVHNLWSVLGGRYLPSAAYKVRMLVFEDAWLGDSAPIISGIEVESDPR